MNVLRDVLGSKVRPPSPAGAEIIQYVTLPNREALRSYIKQIQNGFSPPRSIPW